MKFLERFWFGCGHCHTGEGCPINDYVDEHGNLPETPHGLRLCAIMLLVFILPLLTAIGGACLADYVIPPLGEPWQDFEQVGGAIVGFFVGVALARGVFWCFPRLIVVQRGVE